VVFERVGRRLDELREECVEFLVRICSIPALGPDNQGTGEMEKYLVIRETVRSLGPDEEIEVHAPDDRVPDGVRPNLLALFRGGDGSKTLWILTHIDVVPGGERAHWEHDPFEPRVKDGIVAGRGVEDNGQSLAASVFAVKAVKETCGFGMNVGLALVSDEETGSRYGLDYVLRERLDLFSPDDLIVVPDAGNRDGDQIEVAEKHLLHVRFSVKGKQGHASRPDLSRNSLRAAAHLIVELDRALPGRFTQSNDFFTPNVSTFEPTRKDPNVPNVNTIPGEDVFYFDCRVLPETDLSSVTERMRITAAETGARFGVEIEVEECMKFEAPDPTPADSPVVVALARAVQEVFGVQARPVGIGGQTVAAFFRKRGLPAAVWQKAPDTPHAPNEHILVEDLVGSAKVFARMMI
jgi:succinyl-diaminopimelate desuccinylase